MTELLLGTVALDPNRWTADKHAYIDLHDVLPVIHRAGFHAVEVWQYHVSRKTDDAVRALRTRADALSIRMPILGIYPVLHNTGEAAERDRAEAERLLDLAGKLGVRTVKLWAGTKAAGAVSPEDRMRSLAALAHIADYATARGLALTIETHENTLCDSVEACLRLIDELNRPEVRVCFQPFDFSNTASTLEAYGQLAPLVTHLHFQGRKSDSFSLLRDAEIDYRAFVESLAAHGFEGSICIEFVKDCIVDRPEQIDLDRVLANAAADARYVRELAASAGLEMAAG
jgi:sugar phosphate isomerase/epimerase